MCSSTTNNHEINTVDLRQNPSSPYYIHPSENPYSVIVTLVLSENNYHFQSCSFSMAVIFKNSKGFLNDSVRIPQPTNLLHSMWNCCNNLIISWNLTSLSQSISQTALYFDHVDAIWNDLRNASLKMTCCILHSSRRKFTDSHKAHRQ